MTKLRLRQHVNPLSDKYKIPITFPDWKKIYPQYDLPLHLDIGCARGEFLQQMAQLHPETNFLGVEIRQPLVVEANKKKLHWV